MSNKINARLQHKIDTQENWEKATNFIPLKGELIIYDIDANNTSRRIKIGDGITPVNDLEFVSAQSDYEQNDSSQPDYIKNRTHYINGEEYITLVNKTLGASDWKNESTSVKSVSYNLNLDTFMDLEIGDIIYIDFNNSGTETGYAIKIDTKGNYFCGNGNLEDNNMENSGEDFCIILKEEVAE